MKNQLTANAKKTLMKFVFISVFIELIGIGLILASIFMAGSTSDTAGESQSGSILWPLLIPGILLCAVSMFIFVYGTIAAKKQSQQEVTE